MSEKSERVRSIMAERGISRQAAYKIVNGCALHPVPGTEAERQPAVNRQVYRAAKCQPNVNQVDSLVVDRLTKQVDKLTERLTFAENRITELEAALTNVHTEPREVYATTGGPRAPGTAPGHLPNGPGGIPGKNGRPPSLLPRRG